jgi:uncharacterized OB-fold protein
MGELDDRKPVPVPDERSAGFWEAAAAGVLAIQRCEGCGHWAHPPVQVCRVCHGVAPLRATPVSGRGRLRTWTVARTAFLPSFERDLPYVLGDVELEEQPELRIVAVVHGLPEHPVVGEPVVVGFEARADGPPVPCFHWAGGADVADAS